MSMPAEGRRAARARTNIDRLLADAGWIVQNRESVNIDAGRGIAIREFQSAPGDEFAGCLH
jgi:type I restriction enzyme R subunit